MIIKPYSIKELVPLVSGDICAPYRKGSELVKLFNAYGFKDIYDENGLPDIGKKNGQRPSRNQYVEKRLGELTGKVELRQLLENVLNNSENKVEASAAFDKILKEENYAVKSVNDQIVIEGGIIVKNVIVHNEAHFQEIQNRILIALDDAQVSIKVVVAWFTNETLFNKLKEKYNQGVDVEVAIYDDGINKKHGVKIEELPHKLIKRGKRGGLMHDKFCIIDNQVVITGSYNWTDNAEFKNDENITVQKDPSQATEYSKEYRRLTT